MLKDDRAPYVEFRQVAIEDRAASIATGRRVVRDENRVFIMQIGSRDQVEKSAIEWLAQIKKQALGGTYPEEWQRHFQAKYDRWLEGLDTPPVGMPISEWPTASPAEVENLKTAHVLTVEDLANLSEDGMARVGMGTRELREKAKTWLAAANDVGKVAAEVIALRAENADLKQSFERLMAKFDAKRGRPPKKAAI